jgi:hypothetical protein
MPGKVYMYLYTIMFPNARMVFLGVVKRRMTMDEIVFVFKEANDCKTRGEIISIVKNTNSEYFVEISTGESATIYSTFVDEIGT